MASLSYLNQLLRTNTLPVTPLNSTPSISPPTIPAGFRSKHLRKPIVSANVSRRMVYVQADSNDGEWEPEKEEPKPFVAVAVAEVEPEPVESEKEILKKALVGLFYGTDRGLKASSETGAEILELVTQLEAKNPTPASTEAFSVLNGKWILAYTSYAGLYPLLSSGIFPLLKVEELSQIIDSESLTGQNSVKFVGPLITTSISTTAKFEIRSPNRLKIKFEEGIIGIPELTDALEIPENVELFGQIINLTHFKEILTSVQNTAASVPSLKFPILNSYNSQSWLLTSYLDEELRIAKSDGGSVYVLIKEGSSLLKY